MALAALAILGHKSAHSFPMGPVIADPIHINITPNNGYSKPYPHKLKTKFYVKSAFRYMHTHTSHQNVKTAK